MRYRSLYERLVANTRLSIAGNPQSCWIWTGDSRRGHPALTIRVPGSLYPRRVGAHRKMIELTMLILFPFDEAGHLCGNTMCINPDHLEPQTKAFNMFERWGAASRDEGCMIPALFPVKDALQEAADKAWDGAARPAVRCPF